MTREPATSSSRGRKNRSAFVRARHAITVAKRTAISSRIELIPMVVAHFKADEVFGDWLIANRGRIGSDLDLGI